MIFENFVNWYEPKIVTSFVDRRWCGNTRSYFHESLGFKFKGYVEPDYRIVTSKSTRVIENIDEKVEGYKIWNCGKLKYVWRR